MAFASTENSAESGLYNELKSILCMAIIPKRSIEI